MILKKTLPLRTLKKTLSLTNPNEYSITKEPKENTIHEDPKEDFITENPKENSITEDPKENPIFEKLRRFRTLNAKTLFGFLVMVYNRVSDGDKFLYKNFCLGRPCFHLKIEFKEFFS